MTIPPDRKQGKRIVGIDASKLQQFRRMKGWSQEVLAEVAHLSARTISQAERGEPVFATTLARLAEALRIPPSELVRREAPEKRVFDDNQGSSQEREGTEIESIRLIVTMPSGGEKVKLGHIVAVLKGLGCRVRKLKQRRTERDQPVDSG